MISDFGLGFVDILIFILRNRFSKFYKFCVKFKLYFTSRLPYSREFSGVLESCPLARLGFARRQGDAILAAVSPWTFLDRVVPTHSMKAVQRRSLHSPSVRL